MFKESEKTDHTTVSTSTQNSKDSNHNTEVLTIEDENIELQTYTDMSKVLIGIF